MTDKITKLKEEIAKLEKLIEHDHFRGLVDKARAEQNYNRLRKFQRELKELEEGK